MITLQRLLGLREPRALPHKLHALVTHADEQTLEQWELVNRARIARGEPPIDPPFRPRDLIDPREGEDRD